MVDAKIYSLVFGVATGDALGCPVQFFKREQVKSFNIKGMAAHGTYNKEAGTWTDDTSMTLALADSLAHTEKIDYDDIMQRFYAWMYKNEYTPAGKAFDLGRTCMHAIRKFSWGNKPLECGGKGENQNGNGSLMRISPLLFYIDKHFGKNAFASDSPVAEEAFQVVHNVSRLTHAHPIALLGCDIYIALLQELLGGTEKSKLIQAVFPKIQAFVNTHADFSSAFSKYERLFRQDFAALSEEQISSTGYVVDTLEAALWSFLTTDSYRECLLKVINLGGDTDSIGAVAGAVAGLYYRDDSDRKIPDEWISVLQNRELIDRIVEALSEWA